MPDTALEAFLSCPGFMGRARSATLRRPALAAM